jgi:hypothetical protein
MKRRLGHRVDPLHEMFSGCGNSNVPEVVVVPQCSRDPLQGTVVLLVVIFQVAQSRSSQVFKCKKILVLIISSL